MTRILAHEAMRPVLQVNNQLHVLISNLTPMTWYKKEQKFKVLELIPVLIIFRQTHVQRMTVGKANKQTF